MTNSIKHRSILFAILLSLLSIIFPGLGHMFAGQMRRGLTFLFGIIFIFVITAFSGVMHYFYGAVTTYLILLLTWVYMIIDVYLLNRSKDGVKLKGYNKWYIYLVFAIFSNLLINFVDVSWGYRHYRVGDDANAPAIQKGDLVLAKMNYGQSEGLHIAKVLNHSHPIYVIDNSELKIGSYALFYKQKENLGSRIYIARVFAIGPSNFKVKEGTAYLNGRVNDKLTQYQQRNSRENKANVSPIYVAANTLLLERSNATNPMIDAQFFLVPINNIQGKVILILWSHDITRIGNKLT